MIRIFTFTFRNPQTGKIYFRLMVPKHLRPYVGRTEIVRTLKTTDKAVATPRAMQLYCQILEKFRNYEKQALAMSKKSKKKTKQPDKTFGLIEVTNIFADGTKQTFRFDSGDPDKDFEQAQKLSQPGKSHSPTSLRMGLYRNKTV